MLKSSTREIHTLTSNNIVLVNEAATDQSTNGVAFVTFHSQLSDGKRNELSSRDHRLKPVLASHNYLLTSRSTSPTSSNCLNSKNSLANQKREINVPRNSINLDEEAKPPVLPPRNQISSSRSLSNQESCSEKSFSSIKFNKQFLDTNFVLRQFLRNCQTTATVNTSNVKFPIYENLCTGCGYGVFDSSGNLCKFCQCMLNGFFDTNSNSSVDKLPISSASQFNDSAIDNIYENICIKCGEFCNGEQCLHCGYQSELLKLKLKTKSKHKRFFHGIFDTLKRAKINKNRAEISQNSTNNKRKLEIVHNVDGNFNVFHTKEIFDLNEMAKLKNQALNGDQHIYGKIRNNLNLSENNGKSIRSESIKSHKLISANQTTRNSDPTLNRMKRNTNDKKIPNIFQRNSNFFINFKDHLPTDQMTKNSKNFIQENIIEWMTSLRQQTHNYHSNFMTPDDDDSICSIKSIPSIYASRYNSFLSSNTPTTNSSYTSINTMTTTTQFNSKLNATPPRVLTNNLSTSSSNSSWTSTTTDIEENSSNILRKRGNLLLSSMSSSSSSSSSSLSSSSTTTLCIPVDLQHHGKATQPPKTKRKNFNSVNCYSRDDEQQKSKQTFAIYSTTIDDHEIIERIENFKRNIMEKQQQQQQQQQYIKLRSKRKAIYVKTDDDDQLQFDRATHNDDNDAKLNSFLNNDQQLLNKNNFIKNSSLLHSNNRNGIFYDSANNSEFVSDLLNVFDSFLKRDLNENLIDSNETNSCDKIEIENEEVKFDKNNDFKNYNEKNDQQQSLRSVCEENVLNQNSMIVQSKLICNSIVFKNFSKSTINSHDFSNNNNINFHNLIINLMLSKSLNKIILFYDKHLIIFLQAITERNSKYCGYSIKKLTRIFNKLNKKYYELSSKKLMMVEPTTEKSKLLNNGDASNNQIVTATINKSLNKHRIPTPVIKVTRPAPPPPPPSAPLQVPPLPPVRAKTTKKTFYLTKDEKEHNAAETATTIQINVAEEENIYQPIWKFQTVGSPLENDTTNDTNTLSTNLLIQKDVASKNIYDINESSSLLSNAESYAEEDHGEWETDDEFMFSTKPDNSYVNLGNDNSNCSIINNNINDDTVSVASSTISTLTGASATVTSGVINVIDDDESNSRNDNSYFVDFRNRRYRSVCILFSTVESKKSTILYNYDRDRLNRVHNSSHKNRKLTITETKEENLIDCGRSNENISKSSNLVAMSPSHEFTSSSSIHSYDSNKNISSNISITKENDQIDSSNSKRKINEDNGSNYSSSSDNNKISPLKFLPESVQAWKYMLLDVNYMEDEEDMIFSENELSELKDIHPEDKVFKFKDPDLDTQSSKIQLTSIKSPSTQIYKSKSIDNLFNDSLQEKTSIKEKIRSKLQRNVHKLNNKQIKDGKKTGKNQSPTPTFRHTLCMDDSDIEKYLIFNAKLDDVQKSKDYPHVPLFVVDCINLIEQNDSIVIDGLYRQSGNKTAIDDLKKKLTDNYFIYKSLLADEDIHTITGLLKLFFRDLKTALIPSESYDNLPDNLVRSESLPEIKRILNQIPDPSKATLKYLLKHLTKVAQFSHENRMPISNLAIVWGPCILMSETTGPMDIARINTLMKTLIENYDEIYGDDNERLIN